MKKYMWVIPALTACGTLAAAISTGARCCDSMTVFWLATTFVMFVLTIQAANEENF